MTAHLVQLINLPSALKDLFWCLILTRRVLLLFLLRTDPERLQLVIYINVTGVHRLIRFVDLLFMRRLRLLCRIGIWRVAYFKLYFFDFLFHHCVLFRLFLGFLVNRDHHYGLLPFVHTGWFWLGATWFDKILAQYNAIFTILLNVGISNHLFLFVVYLQFCIPWIRLIFRLRGANFWILCLFHQRVIIVLVLFQRLDLLESGLVDVGGVLFVGTVDQALEIGDVRLGTSFRGLEVRHVNLVDWELNRLFTLPYLGWILYLERVFLRGYRFL